MPDELSPEDMKRLEEIQGLDDLLEAWKKSEPILEQMASVFCHHRRFNIDTSSRRVYCRDCGQEVDALSALMVFTTEWSHFESGLERMRSQKEELSARVEELKREERNAKARLARAKHKEN